MEPSNYNEADVHRLFDDALSRASHDIADRATIDGIMVNAYGSHGASLRRTERMMRDVKAGRRTFPQGELPEDISAPHTTKKQKRTHVDDEIVLRNYRPDTTLTGMPPREFAGPNIGNAALFPLEAMSLFTALGGVGKTATMISMAAHVAAGKSWGLSDLKRRRVVMFFVEEPQSELNRKFGASTSDWSKEAKETAADNLRLISLVGHDPRFTARVPKGSVIPTSLVQEVVDQCRSFSAELVIFDHLQGFTDGDLNASDTATALALAANSIVSATGAAVVFTAHVNKSQIGAETVDAGFTTGSLAFENAARQVTGAIKLPEKEAEEMGVEPTDCIKLVMPKNSYGPPHQESYLEKEYVRSFHTVKVQPYVPKVRSSLTLGSREERLQQRLRDYIDDHQGTTKNKLDALSGTDGPFKASKAHVRRALEEMIDEGVIVRRPVDQEERKGLGLPQQTREILEIGE